MYVYIHVCIYVRAPLIDLDRSEAAPLFRASHRPCMCLASSQPAPKDVKRGAIPQTFTIRATPSCSASHGSV